MDLLDVDGSLNLGILNKVLEKISVPENSLAKYRVRKTDRLFDSAVGFDDIKEIFQLSINADKPVHILLVGPPASAKSLFISCLAKLERSYYAVGSSSTKSGIDISNWTLSALFQKFMKLLRYIRRIYQIIFII